MRIKRAAHTGSKHSKPLRIGFLPEIDCAPVVVAHEFGLFKQYQLEVEISTQPSWKHVHDKIIHGQLDAAHAPGMLPFLINLGVVDEPFKSATALVLSLGGNAIIISRELWRLGVRNATTLREQMWNDRGKKIYSFAVTSPLSTQYFMLRDWLRAPKAPPCTEMRLECVPPEQLFPLLKLGYLDGFCAAEPWGSVALQAKIGKSLETSLSMAPGHPEKVLLVRQDFVAERSEEHLRLIAALTEACYLCDQAENRLLLCELLAQPHFVNAPSECLRPGLVGPLDPDSDHGARSRPLVTFYHDNANEPTPSRASWLSSRLLNSSNSARRPAALNQVFRPDIFRRAQALLPPEVRSDSEPMAHTRSLVSL